MGTIKYYERGTVVRALLNILAVYTHEQEVKEPVCGRFTWYDNFHVYYKITSLNGQNPQMSKSFSQMMNYTVISLWYLMLQGSSSCCDTVIPISWLLTCFFHFYSLEMKCLISDLSWSCLLPCGVPPFHPHQFHGLTSTIPSCSLMLGALCLPVTRWCGLFKQP